MPVKNEKEVAGLLGENSRYLQTAVVAVSDDKVQEILNLFGRKGVSNIHYPGSAPLIHVYEEPHDGEFDSVKARYNYSARFCATNFKRNSDWLLRQ